MGKSAALVLFGVLMMFFMVPMPVYAERDKPLVAAKDLDPLDNIEAYRSIYGRFVTNGAGLVVDRELGFEWIVGPDQDTTWDEGKSWVESLSTDGGEWRMPAREELRSLYKKDAGASNISPSFKTRGRFVWTGEIVDSSHVWGFCFASGNEFWPRSSYSQGARAFAVRFQRPK
jgi:hypothetical protein